LFKKLIVKVSLNFSLDWDFEDKFNEEKFKCKQKYIIIYKIKMIAKSGKCKKQQKNNNIDNYIIYNLIPASSMSQ